MNTLWIKAIRDLRLERVRSFLVVLAIAAGIAAFSTVLSAWAVLTRELDRGYLSTNPAAATLRTDAVDDSLLARIEASPEIADAEGRRTVRARIRTGPMRWRPLVLFVVRDYGDIRVSVLKPQKGVWPPGKGELLIERDAFGVARAKIGDDVTVKMSSGREYRLRLAGSVHDVGQAQARMENLVYGYITLETLEALGETPVLNEVLITTRGDSPGRERVADAAASVKRLIESQGHPVRRVDVPEPGKHPHGDLMGMLLLSMSSFGVFVLILSGILVVNLLTAVLAGQVRQIGIMQALGGSRQQIARIYFAQAFFMGVVAAAVGIPLGMWGNRLLCRSMAKFLNFDIASFEVPVTIYLLAIAVGVLTPVAAAAWPVGKGTRVPARVALSDYGVAATSFGTTRFDRSLATLSGLSRPVLFAMRNSFRRRSRLVLTVLTLAAGGLFFMSALNIRASFAETLDRLFAQRGFHVTVALSDLAGREAVARAVAATPGVRTHEGWITGEASLLDSRRVRDAHDHDGGDRFPTIAIRGGTSLLRHDLIEGRAIEAGERDAMVVNSALAARYPSLRPGSSVRLLLSRPPAAGNREPLSATFRVVGVTREAFGPAVAYLPLTVDDEQLTNSIRLVLADPSPEAADRVKVILEKNLERQGIRAISSTSQDDTRVGFDQHLVMLYVFLIIVSVIIGGVGGLGLATTMSLNILERRREMGVLRAIGATPRTIALLVGIEAVVVGLLSWLLASLAAWPLSWGIGNAISAVLVRGGLDFRFDPAGLWIWFLASIALSAVAVLSPAWHASRGSVREALAYE